MNTTRYEDLTKCDATLCGESRANGHCDRERYEYINGYIDPVTGSYINGYSKYYWGESRCPADRINASFSTDDAWQRGIRSVRRTIRARSRVELGEFSTAGFGVGVSSS